jgi:hypothetical protein
MQLAGDLRGRAGRPQGDQFADFLVGPEHGGPRIGTPQRPSSACGSRRHFGEIARFCSAVLPNPRPEITHQ